jgi:hypothetical protein
MDFEQRMIRARWIGALQVQFMNSAFYINMVNTLMLAATFWYTSAYRIQRVAEWVNIWVFLGVAVAGFAILMLVDFKYILPVRQAFLNKQAYKHENEALFILKELQADMTKVKRELKIVD